MSAFYRSVLVVAAVLGSFPSVVQAEEPTTSTTAAKDSSPPQLVAEDPLEKRLEETLIMVNFQQTPLKDVCAHLADVVGIDIVLDSRGLDDFGITEDDPYTLSVRQNKLPARAVLDLLFDSRDIGWMLKNGVLVVTSADEVEKNMVTRVYKVGDLLPPLREKPAPTPAPPSDATPGYGPPPASAVAVAPNMTTADVLGEMVIELIDPTSWDEVGGPGSIQCYGELLIVRHTIARHRQLRELLNEMRAAKPDFSSHPVEWTPAPSGGGFCGGYSSAAEFFAANAGGSR